MELLKDKKLRDVVPFLAGLEGGKLNNSNSDKVVLLYSLLWLRRKSTMDFKCIFHYDMLVQRKFTMYSFSQLMFEYQNEVLEFYADKNVAKLNFYTCYRMTPYVSAMVYMLKNVLSWSNWLFSDIYVNTGSYDERLLQVLPSCMKRCDSVHIDTLDHNDWNHELLEVVPFLENVAVDVIYHKFGVAVDYIGNLISNTSECKLQHLKFGVYVLFRDIFEFPNDIINGILEFCHVLETVIDYKRT